MSDGVDSELAVAMLIDAAARAKDPVQRLIESLSPELRPHAEETVRLRRDLEDHATSLLAAGADVRLALAHAEWLQRHASEVAYRWSSLVAAATRFEEREAKPVTFSARPVWDRGHVVGWTVPR